MKSNTLVFLGFVFICLINISAPKPPARSAAPLSAAKTAPENPGVANAGSASPLVTERLTERSRSASAAHGPALR